MNADGIFNITDVVMMQKWLLAVPDAALADWKAGDLCQDDIINVFDLSLMKRKLIEQ
ncbi:MAG: dockerin type I repeat-containing protein [Ruminococcus sp.]